MFEELYPGVPYTGEKYLITAGKREIKIYNLLTNNLRAAFSTGFNLDLKTVPERDGYFQFRVKKDIFSEAMENLKLTGLK
ncbi:MAG: hypothetical protein ACM3Q2_18470 [Syntrophothermus sp.]